VQLPGASGSIYSIKDYFSFNPLLIDREDTMRPDEQIKEIIGKAEQLGLRLMIDLVINHCAVDAALLKEHPEWFQWKKNGRVEHPFAKENGKKVVWRDLARFDHRHTKDQEGLYQFYIKVIKFLISLGFHGFRCDAAYQVPRRLWERLIGEIKSKYPDSLFFAETLGCSPDQTRRTAGAGFDYIFNSSKWWDYRKPWLMEQYNLTRDTAPSIAFPESHDTHRLANELDGNIDGLKQRYLFSALFSAGTMMPIGYEYGFRKKLHVVRTKPKNWEKTDIDLTDFIRNVNSTKERHSIFQEEAPTEILYTDNPNILVMWKASTTTREEALIILNKDIHHHQHFYVDSLCNYVQAGLPCIDVSPEYPLDYLPEPFTYDLRPGQGIVLVTSRNHVQEEE
jgi:starch synthase (maltosyl-transferring)